MSGVFTCVHVCCVCVCETFLPSDAPLTEPTAEPCVLQTRCWLPSRRNPLHTPPLQRPDRASECSLPSPCRGPRAPGACWEFSLAAWGEAQPWVAASRHAALGGAFASLVGPRSCP